MIFITTVFLWCAYYLHASAKALDSEDAKNRPWAYDHTSAMGMGFGFFINLIFAVIVGIVLEVMIDLSLPIAFISCISLIGLWFFSKSNSQKQSSPSQLSHVVQNAFQGKEIDLNDYLTSDKYIEHNDAYFWKVKGLDTGTPIYQDSEGNYWSLSSDVITLSDDKGLPIKFTAECVIDGLEYSIAFHYSLTFGNTLEDLIDIFNLESIDGDSFDMDIQEMSTTTRTHELFSIQDDSGNSYDELPFNDREINVFKHGRQLLDRRYLTDKCLFKAYALESLDAAPNINETQNYLNDEQLEVYRGPYHWWSTEKLPAKKGSKAFEDNDGNVFYVGRKKNTGVCHIRNGVPVEDMNVEIRIFWDSGYFMYEFL